MSSLAIQKRNLYFITKCNAVSKENNAPFFVSLFFETLCWSSNEFNNHRNDELKRVENLSILLPVPVVFLQDIGDYITQDFCRWITADCDILCKKAKIAYELWKGTSLPLYEKIEKANELIKIKSKKYYKNLNYKMETMYSVFQSIAKVKKYFDSYEVLFRFYQSSRRILPKEILFAVISKWQDEIEQDRAECEAEDNRNWGHSSVPKIK
ncbi:MAG: hypothetical protein ACOH2E_04590 [Candidatus Paracaedibacter sp.]